MSAMKFCRECNNILYPKEEKGRRVLLFACRNCEHQEVADNNCVYRHEVQHAAAERTQVLQDVASDPTLPRTKEARCAACGHGEAVFFQAMVAATGGADVPPRYLRPEVAVEAVAGAGEAQIPIIDYGMLMLDNGEESSRLHKVCQDWGFFQLTNHGIPYDVVEGMKSSIQQFFQLPAETKKQFAQERGQLEGYGQLFVVSEDQKLDWADILYLNTQPPKERNMRFWPDQPEKCRSTLDRYSAAVKHVADSLLAAMAKNLGLEPEVIAEKFVSEIQSVRMNYYPPCAQADKVVGFSPHSDSDLLTLVLQVNHVQGLQIKRNGSWFPVKPIEGAFIVNIGDIFEIFTNGRYRSIEHRAVVDPTEERLSVAAFHSPSIHTVIGPLKEIMAHEEDEAYKTVDHEEFMRLFFSAKLEGKSFLDRMKLKSG